MRGAMTQSPAHRTCLGRESTPAPCRTLTEVFKDCVQCLRGEGNPLPHASPFLGGVCGELAARTALWFRIGFAVTLAVLAASTVAISAHNAELERRLAEGEDQVSDISRKVTRTEDRSPTRDELGALRDELVNRFSVTLKRIEALEERNRAAKRVIAAASRSVVFLQGAYGFEHEETGKPLRYLTAPNGEPFKTRHGGIAVSPEGGGPPVEVNFTGTAFVVGTQGHLLTNRHVAIPWEDDDALERFAAVGFAPVMRRFVGFLPGETESFTVRIAGAGDDDVAVLRASLPPGPVSHLEIASRQPRPGDDVIVMGYPTGIRALVARAGERFIEELEQDGELDFWLVTRKLSEAGGIAPLASRGIVGQVSEAAVVYDAETARGGSGGPVLDLDGKVIAINSAIIPEFGGSNIGVPIRRTLGLLARTAESEKALAKR